MVSTAELLSFVCAGLAAMGNALANVMQRKASLLQPPGRRFGPRLLADLVTSATWLIGFGGLVASFVLQAVALGLGQLSAVEPIITLEVPLTLLVASRVFHARLGPSEWNAIWIMTAGMIALVAVLDPRPGDEVAVSPASYAIAGSATAGILAALVLAARRGGVLWRTACLGAAAGTSFGLTATLIKQALANGTAHGPVAVLSTWQAYVAVAFGILGLILMQAALHGGPLLAAQPGFTLMDPLVSVLWGTLVYDETTRTGLWLLPAAAGAVAVGIAVHVLARSPLLATLAESGAETAGPGDRR